MSRSKITSIALFLIAISTTSVFAYTGTLTASNGMGGTGVWLNSDGKSAWHPASLGWTVTLTQPNNWHYAYSLSVYKGEVSHFILEVSPTFTMQNIKNAAGDFNGIELADYSAASNGNSNPGMPGTIHGIKFDNASGTTFNIGFDSDRAPVWGDFYSKSGHSTAWNLGLTNHDTDPTAPAANGAWGNHILVPDTVSKTVVPEPSGMFALTAALIGLAGLVVRKRR